MDFERKQKTGVYTILTYLFVFYILSVFVQAIVKKIYVGLGGNNSYTFAGLIQISIYLVLIIPIALINKNDLKQDVTNFRTQTNIKEKSILIPFLAGFGIMYAINIFVNIFVTQINNYSEMINLIYPNSKFSIFSQSENQSYIEKILTEGGFLGASTMFIAAVFFGPFVEEMVFRKGIFSLFKNNYLAIIVSSLLFASIHIISSIGSYNILSIVVMTIPYLASGIAFGIMYTKNNRNILISTVVHMLSNLISVVAVLIM